MLFVQSELTKCYCFEIVRIMNATVNTMSGSERYYNDASMQNILTRMLNFLF